MSMNDMMLLNDMIISYSNERHPLADATWPVIFGRVAVLMNAYVSGKVDR